MFMGLLLLWFGGKLKKEEALHVFLVTIIAWVLTQLIKSTIPTLRPFQVLGSLPMTLTIPFDSSFPSGHTASAFALAVSLWLKNKKLGILFLFGAFLVAWGRIASNVHFFGDILAGSGVGIAVSGGLEKFRFSKIL
jgi:undecaprenyl-diphosphatase